MNILLKLLIFFIITVFTNTVFSASWDLESNLKNDDSKTIKELKEEVETIDKEKEQTELRLNKLKRQVIISDFFRNDLNDIQKIELNTLALEYKETKEKLSEKLKTKSEKLHSTKNTIKKLLENEKEIYKKLLPFIKIEKYEEYKDFIKKDLDIINQNSNLESEWIKKESIIKEKIDDIKEKIEEHNEILSNNLKEIVNKKIDQKLNELISKEKFQNLNWESKIKLFNKLIENIDIKKNKLEEKENKTRLLIKKIELYKIIVDRIKMFKENYIEKEKNILD